MVSDQTLSTDVFTAVRTALVSASLATTTGTTPTTVSQATIAAAFNDRGPARPQVVIVPASISESEYKFGLTRGRQFINVVIECYAPTTLAIDQLQDQIVYTLSENAISGLQLVGYTSDYAFGTIGENKFHLKTLTINYDRE